MDQATVDSVAAQAIALQLLLGALAIENPGLLALAQAAAAKFLHIKQSTTPLFEGTALTPGIAQHIRQLMQIPE